MYSLRCTRLLFSLNRIMRRTLQILPTKSPMYVVAFQSRHTLRNCRFVHTVKGWKALANPKLTESEADDTELDADAAPCEEGTGAVPHSVLVAELNKCKTVPEQLNALFSTLSLTEEDAINRNDFCSALSQVLEPYFPSFKIHQFGSSVNGLGFKGCDIDVCIQTSFSSDTAVEYAKMDVPLLEDVLSNKVLKSDVIRLHPKLMLRYIRRIIRKHFTGIREPILLIRARCPILRFYNEKYDLFCDFSCQNRSALKNTKLLRFVSHLDERVAILLKVLRYWGKHGKFIGDIDMFNSYAFSLLGLYFLQNTNPPVLLPFNDLLHKSDYIQFGDVSDVELMCASLKTIPPSQNKQTVDELLRDFFFFYMYYDFSRVMLPWTSFSVPKQDFRSDEDPPTDVFELTTICVQDPFRHSFNATACVEYKQCRKFLGSIVEACKVYQNPRSWQPDHENWGILALFASTALELPREKIAEYNKRQTFEITLNPAVLNKLLTESRDSVSRTEELYNKIACYLMDIFNHVLLFKCTQLPNRQKSQNLGNKILRLRMEVSHNTWIGRHLVQREQFSNTVADNPLELEHVISTHLVNQKKCSQVLFRCLCECYGIQDQQFALKICFTLESGKFPVVVPIFLQEYVQTLLNRLL